VPSPKQRFGFSGRIAAIKGVHLLLEAFQQLPQPERAELTLYGQAEVRSDQYYQQLKKQVTHLPNIKCAGVADNAQISQIYRHLDVLVVPSIWPENSPITILEALAHGIPVIASDVKGIADLVQDEVNGLIFANQNVQDLTRQMTRCLDSPELVAQLEAQCRPVKSLSEEIADLIRLYEEVLSESR
jgi:glycosyltransferase involved in cell wall biosynthesis